MKAGKCVHLFYDGVWFLLIPTGSHIARLNASEYVWGNGASDENLYPVRLDAVPCTVHVAPLRLHDKYLEMLE